MEQTNANQMISRVEVEALIRKQAEASDLKLRAELQAVHDKHTEVTHHLEMARNDADAVQRQHLAIEEALPDLESNIQRTQHLKQNIQELPSAFKETKDDLETAVQALKAQVANFSLEQARLYDLLINGQGTAALPLMDIRNQHDRMRVLIDELENQLGRTNARHVTEGSMACNCAHKTINEKMDKLRHRISNVCEIPPPDFGVAQADIHLCYIGRAASDQVAQEAPTGWQVRPHP